MFTSIWLPHLSRFGVYSENGFSSGKRGGRQGWVSSKYVLHQSCSEAATEQTDQSWCQGPVISLETHTITLPLFSHCLLLANCTWHGRRDPRPGDMFALRSLLAKLRELRGRGGGGDGGSSGSGVSAECAPSQLRQRTKQPAKQRAKHRHQ